MWEPVLVTDWRSPRGYALERISDPRARQYWDEQHRFSSVLRQQFESDGGHPRPECCMTDGVVWDVAALYPADVRWDESLPPAVYLSGPVLHVSDDLEKAVKKLTSAQAGSTEKH